MLDASPPAPALSLDAMLPADQAGTLFRHPAMARRRVGRTRSVAATLTWLDTAKGTLAEQGLALEASDLPRAPRRLLQSMPPSDQPWSLASPTALLEGLAVGSDPSEAGGAPLLPIAGFRGRRLSVKLDGGIEAVLLHGTLHGTLHRPPAQAQTGQPASGQNTARLTLTGPPDAVLELMRELAASLPVQPTPCSLAEQGRAFAKGEPPRPRRLGAPRLTPDLSVEAALRQVIGHLTEVLIWHAPIAAAGEDPVGVHQMRVALRRLRSALAAFRTAVDAPELRRFDKGLKALARSLGPVRDWDVFLAGLGAELAGALPEEPRIAALLAAGQRHRDAAHAALRDILAGPDFRLLLWDAVALDAIRPWRAEADPAAAAERLAAPLKDFARHLLAKRWRKLTAVGEDIAHLPDAEFHALRLDGKRMRYLAELFAPLFNRKRSRRFLDSLAEMQEQFGLANDASVARALVEAEAHGPDAWAAGVAEGWVLARTRRARSRSEKAWTALLETECFWN